ncbi:MAG: phage tail sheath C-terminal domain-containing protein [Bacteroidota bacterium]
MESQQTPGIYQTEVHTFPNSVAEVATAIPAFIGYTPQAIYQGKSCHMTPMMVNSMADFLAIFGYPEDPTTQQRPPQYLPSYFLTKRKQNPPKGKSYSLNGDTYTIDPDPNTIYYLYNSLSLFYQNGGGPAYIVSTGSYGPSSGKPIQPGEHIVNPNVSLADLQKGLKTLKKVEEVTMYLFPEATLLNPAENGTLMKQTLAQCNAMETSIGIFDIIGGREPDPLSWQDDIQNFRNATGDDFLKQGVSYFPFVKTTAVSANEVTYENIHGGDVRVLASVLNPSTSPNPKAEIILKEIKKGKYSPSQGSAMLAKVSPTYQQIVSIIQEKINVLPPSGVMAGVYSMVDANEGVWKAPANVSPMGVSGLTLEINGNDQQSLNIDAASGKSINALRTFPGQGVLVWGARTLDGNAQDWQYLNVVRTIMMIKQSAKLALRNYAFFPNTADTWKAAKSMLEDFLTRIWRQGGLAGVKPAHAFNVKVGLGSTMTQQDIDEGRLRVTLFVAVMHPAEFIEVNLEQKVAQQ